MPIYSLGTLIPKIDPQSWIAPDAALMGNVEIACNVSIWWGATLRGDMDLLSIGENTNIQDGTVVHTDPGIPVVIGKNVTVGHRVILHGCTVGDNSLIGMGATLLNRVVIGKNCLIGANSLIPEGKVIPDRSLVCGSPGRIIRELTDHEISRLKASADNYVRHALRYQGDLEQL